MVHACTCKAGSAWACQSSAWTSPSGSPSASRRWYRTVPSLQQRSAAPSHAFLDQAGKQASKQEESREEGIKEWE